MRSKIKRTAICVMVFGLPISLPQSGTESAFGISTARADGTLNRLMRWTGYGWSSGYHACNEKKCGLRDALPPVSHAATQTQSVSEGRFELVDPASPHYPVSHVRPHALPNSRTLTQHPVQIFASEPLEHPMIHSVPVPITPMPSGPVRSPSGAVGMPKTSLPNATSQPYRSAITPSSPRQADVQAEDSLLTSPSDLETLPAPQPEAIPRRTNQANELNDWLPDPDLEQLQKLMLDEDTEQVLPMGYRTSRLPRVSSQR